MGLRGKTRRGRRRRRGGAEISMKRLEERRTSHSINSKEQDDKDTVYIPVDMIIMILTKLPARSVSKLICVSKLWSSIIQGKHFTDLYLTRSSTRRLLLSGDDKFYSCQENPSSDHSITRKRIPGIPISPPVRGLIGCLEVYSHVVTVGNPSTGQLFTLPPSTGYSSFFFGYDPVSDLYKVFSMRRVTGVGMEHQIFTLGAPKAWRMIECKYSYNPVTRGICKNGVIYCGAWSNSKKSKTDVIVCFDLRFEEFSLITLPEGVRLQFLYWCRSELVIYNGKITLVVGPSSKGRFTLWVLMDDNLQEWAKVSVVVPCWKDLVGDAVFCCRGTISTGELIFQPYRAWFNSRRVDEFGKSSADSSFHFKSFVGHVESPMFLPRNLPAND